METILQSNAGSPRSEPETSRTDFQLSLAGEQKIFFNEYVNDWWTTDFLFENATSYQILFKPEMTIKLLPRLGYSRENYAFPSKI